MKKLMKNKKGFTLAELLIVVAIIAVLVAVSIPIFTAQLEKSRESVDLANLRAAYAECSTALLNSESGTVNGVTYTAATTGDETGATATKDVVMKQTVSGWATSGVEIGGVTISDTTCASSGTVTVTVKGDGTTEFTK